jgi:DNA modification methylase
VWSETMILKGNCLDILKTLPDSSVDSVVTDPPYELGFMGKSWDSTGIAYNVEVWLECLRVLKPGGHLLAFGGTRTYHRLACAIEDAGFEIRDSIHWTYGSGFPSSTDVSKAIDKRGGADISWFGEWLKQEREKRGISRKELAQHFPSQQAYGGKPASGNTTGCVGNWETGVSIPTNEQFNKLCEILDLPFAKLEEAEREVIKERTMVQGGGNALQMRVGERREVEANITAPATDEAKKWEGWGTALKPSHEPIVVARKPLGGTVASNVMKYGTGALNIDGTRVSAGSENFDDVKGRPITKLVIRRDGETEDEYKARASESPGQQKALAKLKNLGRWPANTIITHSPLCRQVSTTSEIAGGGAKASLGFVNGYEHDGFVGQNITTNVWQCAEGCPANLFPTSTSQGHWSKTKTTGFSEFGGRKSEYLGVGEKDKDGDSADRYFTQTEYSDVDFPPLIYQAKASKAERNAGLDGQNFHPTVKPLALMRYLIKLVTSPGGVVLDPFLGSGTTAIAAVLEGFEWIGSEITPDYWPIIESRVEWAKNQRAKTTIQESLF